MAAKQLQGVGIAVVLVLLVVAAFAVLALTRSTPYERVAGDSATVDVPGTTDVAPAGPPTRPLPPRLRRCESTPTEDAYAPSDAGRLSGSS